MKTCSLKNAIGKILVSAAAWGCVVSTGVAQTVDVWYSSSGGDKKLAPQPSVSFSDGSGTSPTVIVVDETKTYQTMDGFGAAMTGSSAYLMNQKMSPTQRDSLLDDLFTSAGINLSYVRRSIGASDFDLKSYTYNDTEGIENFTIDYDRTDIIPVMLEVIGKNPNVKVMGSPWSAPAWMKKPSSLNGGSLARGMRDTYAQYLVKYIQAYEQAGIPIESMTIQNEPLHTTGQYPSMKMSDRVQKAFLKENLGPALTEAGIDVKVLVYDHNWDQPDYPVSVLDDPVARQYAAGSAFHGYGGDVSAQSIVHDAHPDKGVWFTEITSGQWDTAWSSRLSWAMSNIVIGTTRHWAKGILYWNLALDENFGPQNGGCTECNGIVEINSQTGAVTRMPEYYVLGHIAKFVEPGAVRIDSNIAGNVETVAFDKDGQKILIVHNSGSTAETVSVSWGGRYFDYALGSGDAATFTWSGIQ
jgi:glucosylceramidase